jgi:hypothetical protein
MTFLFLFSIVGSIFYFLIKDRERKSRLTEAAIDGYESATAASSILLTTYLLTSPVILGKILITKLAMYTMGIYTLAIFLIASFVSYFKRKKHENTN